MTPKGSNRRSSDGASDSSSVPRGASKKPRYSRFTQQELPACKPILTPFWSTSRRTPGESLANYQGRVNQSRLACPLVLGNLLVVIATFSVIGAIFIPIGLASLFASQRVVEIVDRYDDNCIPKEFLGDGGGFIQNREANKTCTRSLTVPKHMKSPIYIYYQLDNFYQNHRRYVKSRSDKQLRSKAGEKDTGSCVPEGTTSDGSPIVPCGLIAWSLFNDTYKFSLNSKVLDVNKKNIAWKSDKDHKFGKDVYPKNFQRDGLIGGAKLNASIPLSEQEDLIVWMRTAALPTFRKLYGKIEVDLEANSKLSVVIQNNYNTYIFNGKKKLVLSTTSWIGGKNDFLGIAYLTVGGLCLFLSISFIILYIVRPRPLGDPSYLSWNINPAGHVN